MIWWLSDIHRAKHERLAIAELAECVGWLSAVNWRVGDNMHLMVDFDITHQGEVFALSMTYPSIFPDTPPMIKPRDAKRLSYHQYGPGGELCLEHRPDNWDAAVTGSLMIGSAQRLITGERPTDDAEGIVPSAHQASIGRTMRGETMRFIVPGEALDCLNSLELDVPVPLKAWDRVVKPTWVAALEAVGAEDALMWFTSGLRPATATTSKGFVVRTQRSIAQFQADPAAFLLALQEDFSALSVLLSEVFNGFVLLGDGQCWTALNLFFHQGERHVFHYKTLVAPLSGGRLAAGYETLAQKWVAIVGAGSVGSKIAISLARSGVRNFLLVDDDLLFAANLVRNQLDAAGIGMHKVDALSARLKEIVDGANVHCRRVSLGQQESAGSTESVMEDLAKADLLIDATADPRAFNLIGAVARRQKKPLIWCQVFAGGIGGTVVRLRPDIDPIPSVARDQVHAWCESHGIAWRHGGDENYGATSEEGVPLVADDAEVSVIAAHATRMVIDTLIRETSIFPSTAYAIGLSANWIFTAPFDTWPITFQSVGPWHMERQQTDESEILKFLEEIAPTGDST